MALGFEFVLLGTCRLKSFGCCCESSGKLKAAEPARLQLQSRPTELMPAEAREVPHKPFPGLRPQTRNLRPLTHR